MFSVIIPLYNKEKSISNCVMSVLSQTYQDFEVIIINDGSTDRSAENIEKIKHGKLRIINTTNYGVSVARNRGIREAKHPFLAFLDADDLWQSNYLEEMLKLINIKPNGFLYGCAQTIIASGGKLEKSRTAGLPDNYADYISNYFKVALKGHLFQTSAIIARRSVLIEKDIFFDEKLSHGEDLKFYFSIAFKGPVVFLNKTLTFYRKNAENRAMDRKPNLENRLVGNMHDFSFMMQQDYDIRKYFSEYILVSWGILLGEGYDKFQISHIVKLIDFNSLSALKKIFFYLPSFLKKLIIYFFRLKTQ